MKSAVFTELGRPAGGKVCYCDFMVRFLLFCCMNSCSRWAEEWRGDEGGAGARDEWQECTSRDEGEWSQMRKTCKGERSREVGRTLHKYGRCGRQREGGMEREREWGKGETQREGETALKDSPVSLYEEQWQRREGGKRKTHLTIITVPSSQTCCCRLPWATPRPRPGLARIRRCVHRRHAGWCYACPPSKDQSQRRGQGEMRRGGSEGEAGWSDCEMCLPSEIQLLSSAPLLAASYSLSFCFSISPSRSTHSRLLLHGNHLLVSLSCSAAPVIHNIRPPPPPRTAPLSPQQHRDRCGSVGKAISPLFHPGVFAFPWKQASTEMWQEYRGSAGMRNAASHRSRPVNVAAKVFLAQLSIILQVWLHDVSSIGSGKIKLAPLLMKAWEM